jgi:hypothetical protein
VGRDDGAAARVPRPELSEGLGSSRYAVPLKAYDADRAAPSAPIQTETSGSSASGRGADRARHVRSSPNGSPARARPAPICHYFIHPERGRECGGGARRRHGCCRLEFGRAGGRRGPGGTRLAITLVLKDHVANAPIKIVPWDH